MGVVAAACAAAQNQGEMFMTSAGFLAISTPPGFQRSDGPMPVWFIPEKGKAGSGAIYITPVRIGEGTPFANLAKFIEDDIAGFRKRFTKGMANEEKPLSIPHGNQKVPAWTFRSGEKNNGFERLVFVEDARGLVWLLVLTTSTDADFKKHLPAFETFVKSYKGSIQLGGQ